MNDLNKVKSLKPFTKFLMTIGEIPTSYLISMTYEEQLLWFCNYLEKTVIPTINNNAESVEELQRLYNQLKSYVDNYFNNLDVQDEINNKLDEMVESGELQNIIYNYIIGDLYVAFPQLNINSLTETTNGDCTIIKAKNKSFIIDTYFKNENFSSIQETMNKLNINKIDYFLITHYDSDHYNNLELFINNYDCSDCLFLLPRIPNNPNVSSGATVGYNFCTNLLNSYSLNYEICDNRTINIDNINFKIFNASENDYAYYNLKETDNYNNYSICTEINYRDKKVLLTGDIDTLAQEYISQLYLTSNYDILKDCHHGISNINQTFSNIVNPNIIVETMTKGMLYQNYRALKYPNIWRDFNSKIYIMGYQTEPLIFKINSYNIDIISKNYSNDYINSMTQNYLQYYVDSSTNNQIRSGTQDYPFQNIHEALSFIKNKNSQKVFLNLINIGNEDLSSNISLTNFDYLVIDGKNNTIPNFTIENCKFVEFLNSTFNNTGNEYAIKCTNGFIYLSNVKSTNNSQNFIQLNSSKCEITNELNIQNKTNAIFTLYNGSEILFKSNNYTLQNNNYILSGDTSNINVNQDLINYIKSNLDIAKFMPYPQLRQCNYNKLLTELFVLYDGSLSSTTINLSTRYDNFRSVSIYWKDSDGRGGIDIIPIEGESPFNRNIISLFPNASFNTLYIKSGIVRLINNSQVQFQRITESTISETGTITVTENSNAIGVYKVVGNL